MPRVSVVVTEYQCRACHYKWINRKDGKDGPKPKCCARCKKISWDRRLISARERGLRRRIRKLGLPNTEEFLNVIPNSKEMNAILNFRTELSYDDDAEEYIEDVNRYKKHIDRTRQKMMQEIIDAKRTPQ